VSNALKYTFSQIWKAQTSNCWRTDQRGVRKLNLIGKSEIRRSFDEEAAIDLLLKLGLSEIPKVGLACNQI
jgi:hypothetical protein